MNGPTMVRWMKDMWDFPRSLTGKGTRDTLEYLARLNPELAVHSVPSGTEAFDWTVPDEWNIRGARLVHESGEVIADFADNNLHVVGYSVPCDFWLTLEELQPHLHSLPDQPDAIPYVTSYYADNWGFCLTETRRRSLPAGKYHVLIDSEKSPGEMLYGDMVLRGQKSEEVFFSTYVCHPSMANNELSGPVLSSALAQYIKEQYPDPTYTYRFVFAPETIGSITYLSRNLRELKRDVVCGFVLSCVGDERAYSHIGSRKGDTLADKALEAGLVGLENVKRYSFLERGSDERQYCSPGVDLPVCGFCRSKYNQYPEYHTSKDDLSVVTAEGLEGAFSVMASVIDAMETGMFPKVTVLCEPQLGKRGLYHSISRKNGLTSDVRVRRDVLAYADGQHSIFDIALQIGQNLEVVVSEVANLAEHGLIEFVS